MRLFLTAAALALSLGASGCMGAMHEHHEGMMGQHRAQDCPTPEQSQHGASSEEQAAHDHSAAQTQAECPPADAAEHQHDQPQN